MCECVYFSTYDRIKGRSTYLGWVDDEIPHKIPINQTSITVNVLANVRMLTSVRSVREKDL